MENKFDTSDLFMNGENHQSKTLPGDFKITTPNNSLLSIISGYKYKESYQTLWPIWNTNLQLNPYPNTQLDLYFSGNLSIQCTNPSTWLTNDAWIPLRD